MEVYEKRLHLEGRRQEYDKSAKPVSTPLATHFRLSSALSLQSDDEINYMSRVSYSCAVGSLITRDGVIGYVDSDFTRDLDKSRSLTRYVFTIRGCTISWKATLQTKVALSTTETEDMVISGACKESM
ncbi:secreted RxLR effector protein 161-like [Gossypium raimondii]|uniref:secreted RxLR effector protein 161-like n=1 Tax=Gossypium raimondii TaxID=29730 RepID=UPI00227A618A|nr:secreted RxLR effector protein 161-like [Gossypium raimondii]